MESLNEKLVPSVQDPVYGSQDKTTDYYQLMKSCDDFYGVQTVRTTTIDQDGVVVSYEHELPPSCGTLIRDEVLHKVYGVDKYERDIIDASVHPLIGTRLEDLSQVEEDADLYEIIGDLPSDYFKHRELCRSTRYYSVHGHYNEVFKCSVRYRNSLAPTIPFLAPFEPGIYTKSYIKLHRRFPDMNKEAIDNIVYETHVIWENIIKQYFGMGVNKFDTCIPNVMIALKFTGKVVPPSIAGSKEAFGRWLVKNCKRKDDKLKKRSLRFQYLFKFLDNVHPNFRKHPRSLRIFQVWKESREGVGQTFETVKNIISFIIDLIFTDNYKKLLSLCDPGMVNIVKGVGISLGVLFVALSAYVSYWLGRAFGKLIFCAMFPYVDYTKFEKVMEGAEEPEEAEGQTFGVFQSSVGIVSRLCTLMVLALDPDHPVAGLPLLSGIVQGGNLCDAIVRNIEPIFRYVASKVTHDPSWLNPAYDSELCAYLDEVDILVKMPGLEALLLNDREMQDKIREMHDFFLQNSRALYVSGRDNIGANARISRAMRQVTSWHKVVIEAVAQPVSRICPATILLSGKSGQGKTEIMNIMLNVLTHYAESEFGRKKTHLRHYTKPANSEYYDGYCGQLVYIIDEFLASPSEQDMKQELMELCTFVSTGVCPLNYAKAELKGTGSFQSHFIFLGTNYSRWNSLPVTCPQAIYKRIHFPFEVTRHDTVTTAEDIEYGWCFTLTEHAVKNRRLYIGTPHYVWAAGIDPKTGKSRPLTVTCVLHMIMRFYKESYYKQPLGNLLEKDGSTTRKFCRHYFGDLYENPEVLNNTPSEDEEDEVDMQERIQQELCDDGKDKDESSDSSVVIGECDDGDCVEVGGSVPLCEADGQAGVGEALRSAFSWLVSDIKMYDEKDFVAYPQFLTGQVRNTVEVQLIELGAPYIPNNPFYEYLVDVNTEYRVMLMYYNVDKIKLEVIYELVETNSLDYFRRLGFPRYRDDREPFTASDAIQYLDLIPKETRYGLAANGFLFNYQNYYSKFEAPLCTHTKPTPCGYIQPGICSYVHCKRAPDVPLLRRVRDFGSVLSEFCKNVYLRLGNFCASIVDKVRGFFQSIPSFDDCFSWARVALCIASVVATTGTWVYGIFKGIAHMKETLGMGQSDVKKYKEFISWKKEKKRKDAHPEKGEATGQNALSTLSSSQLNKAVNVFGKIRVYSPTECIDTKCVRLGKYLFIPSHALWTVPDYTHIELRYGSDLGGNVTIQRESLRAKDYMLGGEKRDLVRFTVSNSAKGKQPSAYLLSKEQWLRNFHERRVVRTYMPLRDRKYPTLSEVSISQRIGMPFGTVVNTPEGAIRAKHTEGYLAYDTESFSGDCGDVYMIDQHIIGIHVAYCNGNSIYMPLYLEDCEDDCGVGQMSYMEGKVQSFDLDMPDGVLPLGILNKDYTGKPKNPYRKTIFNFKGEKGTETYVPPAVESKRVPSALNGLYLKGKYYPAWYKHNSDYTRTTSPSLPQDFKAMVKPNPKLLLQGLFPVQERDQARKLTQFEVDNGIPGFIVGMDVSSSAGMMGKVHDIKRAEMYELLEPHKIPGPLLIKYEKEIQDMIDHKVIPPMILLEILKAELKEEGKFPRCFLAASPEHIRWTKSVVGYAIGLMKKRVPGGACCVGINPFSYQWHVLRQEVVDIFPDGQHFGGDLSNCDLSCHPYFIKLMVWFLNQFYRYSKKSREYRELKYCCWSIIHQYRIRGRRFFAIFRGHPSGHYLTTLYNSLVNYVVHVYAYYKNVDSSKYPIEYHFSLKVYGDDSLGKVSAEVAPYYNMHVIREAFADFGMIYTDPDKSINFPLFLRRDQVTFLGRGFTDQPSGFTYSPLNKEAIHGMLLYVRAENGRTVDEALDANIRCALMEMYQYGPDEFDSFRDQLIEYSRRHANYVPKSLVTYNWSFFDQWYGTNYSGNRNVVEGFDYKEIMVSDFLEIF